MNTLKILDAGDVVRYHSAPILHKQDLASHLWEATVFLFKIYPEASKELILYCLTHDCAEIHTSDIASPVKKQYPEIKKRMDELEEVYTQEVLKLHHPDFSEKELAMVKAADILSGIYFTRKRISQGDLGAQGVYDNWLIYYGRLPYLNFETVALYEELTQ